MDSTLVGRIRGNEFGEIPSSYDGTGNTLLLDNFNGWGARRYATRVVIIIAFSNT